MKTCAVIPTYNNPTTIRAVVEDVRKYVEDVIVVDDGSREEARAVATKLKDEGLAHVVFREQNGGKGAAVKTGLAEALKLGFTHALQIDADGQHNSNDIPRMLEASKEEPRALVLGQPKFDESAPTSRRLGRLLSVFWCAVETMSMRVGDPLCGFRVYPVAPAVAVEAVGDAMDFDPEIAVRLAWAGLPIKHVITHVRYIEGGISHFRAGRDTWLISVMHTRLCITGILRLFGWGKKALPA